MCWICGHLYDQVRSPEAEAELRCQDLLCLADPAGEGQHQGSLVNQFILVGLKKQTPLQSEHCTQGGGCQDQADGEKRLQNPNY